MIDKGIYFAALALHVVFIYVFAHFRYYNRNPLVMLWLVTTLGMNIANLVFGWAEEWGLVSDAFKGQDFLWWSLAVASCACAAWRREDPVQLVILRGVLALLGITLLAREAGHFHLVGGIEAKLATAMNLAYLVPTLYMILALGGVRFEWIPLRKALEAAQ